MAKSDARFGYEANLSRQDHDLSRDFGFTTPPGMLLPIFADIASAGDTYYIHHDLDFLRTRPLVSPAMIDVIVHYESFFVPIQMIYQPAENTLFSLNNIQSSLYDITYLQNNNFPLFDYQSFLFGLVHNFRSYDTQQLAKFEAFRLADMLGLNPLVWTNDTNANGTDWEGTGTGYPITQYAPSFFPWQLLAYHTIFEYYYRLDDKTQFDHSIANWDNRYGSTSAVNPAYTSGFMSIHKRPWNFDYFTSLYRSPIVSAANLQQVLPSGVYEDLVQKAVGKLNVNGASTAYNVDARAFTPSQPATYNQAGVNAGLSTAAIRQIFANEKLAMITGRARKNYDSQVLAHFGVNVPKDVKHDIQLIGADHYKLEVGEVTSLASTSDSALGDLAGKGRAFGKGKDLKFTAPTHGVVMTIFSIEPIQRYYGGFERCNAVVNAFDLPLPEYDRLGNVPMFRYETGDDQTDYGYYATDIIGWKERYYEWKRRYDKTSLAFMKPIQASSQYNELGAYMIANPAFQRAAYGANIGRSRPDYEDVFYIQPACLNSLFFVNYQYRWQFYIEGQNEEDWNSKPWLAYSRDPFVVNSAERVKKISWMSKDGEPVYPY